MKHARRDFMQMTLRYPPTFLPMHPFPPSFAGGRGYCLGGAVRYTQINSVFPSILFPIQLEKRVLSWNDHCLIVVAVPEWRNDVANKKKGQTSGTQEGPLDCLWREAKETGVIRRGILGDVYTESLSLVWARFCWRIKRLRNKR
ncbi:hypothetical protein CDAR_564591 [Caerostris darwini]|uniref:Cytochrome P450 n=1 Tax=Caerostris darwini TaxID=1538125 RepID=A0AAV4TKY9_9ARAC|nr:hypothetical protein CDAR_564591 [Caerostris darwini]